MTLEFLATALIVCLAPGIGVIYTLSTALGGGLARGLWAALGCTLVTGLHLVAALAGLLACVLPARRAARIEPAAGLVAD